MLLQLHLHSELNTWLQWIQQRQLEDKKHLSFEIGVTYIRDSIIYIPFPLLILMVTHFLKRVSPGQNTAYSAVNDLVK